MEFPWERLPVVTKDKTDEDPLIRAIEARDLEAVRDLLTTDDAKYKDAEILKTAIKSHSMEIIELLLQNGADVMSTCDSGQTPFFYAVDSGSLEVVKLLLRSATSIHEDTDLLVTAVQRESCELIKLLIQHGADVNAKSQSGMTPLSHAVTLDNIEIVRILLSLGAELENDTEILSLAVAESSEEVIEVLLKNGANPNTQSKGKTPAKSNDVMMDRAADPQPGDHFLWDALELINDLGAKFNYEKQKKGRTPLHLAADLGREEAVSLLLEYGADIDCKTMKGLTPLIIAADKGHHNVVRLLLELDAAIEVVDEFNRTAFHAAAMNGHTDILRMLLDYCFNDHEFLLRNGIYRFSYVKRTLFANALRRAKLEKWKSFVSNIAKHFLKMHAAGVKLPSDVETLINVLMVPNLVFFDACMLEVGLLKSEVIGESDITLFDFLIADVNSLAVFAKNVSITHVLELDDYEARYTIYGSIIRSQFRKAVTRRNLLERGVAVGFRLFPDFEVPDLVVEKILKYMSNKVINACITACSFCKDTTSN